MSVNYTPPPVPASYVPPAAPQAVERLDGNAEVAEETDETGAPSEKFMDMVFAKLQEKKPDAAANGAATLLLKQSAGTGNGLNSAIDGETTTLTLNGQSITLDNETAKKLTDFINHLLAGLPADQTATLTDGNLDGVSSALIATGLTPEKLAALIEALKKKDSQGDAAAAMMAGTVQIVPPPVKRDPIPTTGGSNINVIPQPVKAEPKDESANLATQVNPLTVDSNGDTEFGAAHANTGFANVLKIFEHAQQSITNAASAGANSHGGASSTATPGTPAAGVSPSLSTVPGTGNAGDLDFDASLSGKIFPDGLDWAQKQSNGNAGQAAALTVTGNAVMTSLVGNAAQAITPHPATQIVASAIVKGAADGQSKDITVRLDPPDLGKVEVRLNIDKNHTVRTHIMVEKPETYLMLQRDAQVLQRALADAGLDVSGNSLSFEMAQNGNAFGQDNDGRGGNGSYGGGTASGGPSEDGTVLESRMDWRFEDGAGQTHYNIWA